MKKYLLLKYLFLLSILLVDNQSFAQVAACITNPSADTMICKGALVTLSARNCLNNTTPSQELYSWVNLNNPGSPLGNNTAVIDTGRWEVTITNTNDGSTDKAVVHIQFKPEPGPPLFGINNRIGFIGKCANTKITLSETSGNTNIINHEWYQVFHDSLLATGTSYVVSAPIPYNSVSVVALYTVTGCLLKDTVYIANYPEAKPELGNDTSLCVGTSITLKPTGLADLGQGFLHPDSDYDFDWGSGFQKDSQLVVNSTQYVKLTVKGPFPYDCLSKDSVQVTAIPNPIVSTTIPTAYICYGDTLNGITANASGSVGPYSYAWSPNIKIDDNTSQTVNLFPLTPTVYTVTVTSSVNNCTGTATTTVNVYPQINPLFSFGDTTICPGASVQFSGSATGGTAPYSYSWLPATYMTGSGTSTPTSTPLGNITYYMTVTDNNNCEATKPINVSIASNVSPLVVANVNFADSTICTDASIQLLSFGSGGAGPYSYSWKTTSAPLSDANISNPNSSPTSNTTYSVLVKDSRNCIDSTDINVTIASNVNPLVVANVNFADSTICTNASIQLLSFGSGGAGPYSYSWTTTSAPLTDPSISNPVSSPTSNTTYSVLIKDSRNCIDSTDVNVAIASNVNPLVVANLSFTDSTLCPGSSMQLLCDTLALGGVGPYSYSWTPDPSLTGANISSPTVSPTSQTTYSVSVKDSRNCTNSANVTIDILYVQIISTPDTIALVGDSIKLAADNPSTLGFTYTWKDTLGTVVGNGPFYMAKTSGKYIVEVSNGTCFVSDIQEVFFVYNIVQKIYVPNVFNPGMSEADNSNLRVYGNKVSNENFLFRVYDQWSQLVYETDDFQTAHLTGWNGTMKNTGQVLNAGVYTYFVKGQFYDETTFEKTGTATLIR